MKWKEYFVFSRGERRAVIVLTVLLAVAGGWWYGAHRPYVSKQADQQRDDRPGAQPRAAIESAESNEEPRARQSDRLGPMNETYNGADNEMPAGVTDDSQGGGLSPQRRDFSSSDRNAMAPEARNRAWRPRVGPRYDPQDAGGWRYKREEGRSNFSAREGPSSQQAGFDSAHRRPWWREGNYPPPRRKWPDPQPVDINAADTAMLIALPGIGSKLARRIVAYRSSLGGFQSVDQLRNVYGLRDSTFETLRPWLRCGNSTENYHAP